MTARGSRLRRLASLYATIEHLHSVQLGVATEALREVRQATDGMERQRREDAVRSHLELIREDRTTMQATLLAVPAVIMQRQALERAALLREQNHLAAKEAHEASRLELRQIQEVIAGRQVRERRIDDRRAQGIADDRFLSRREWLKCEQRQHGDEGDLIS